ncbi:MAG TPA: hypothetical protein VFU38_10995 [Candidatus Krumholzibacteria bacterium]|nr:hypothetical protein [Candidatus Krumholzibacteria bacterium]
MANPKLNAVLGVTIGVAVVIVALIAGGSRFDVGFCLLLGLIAIEMANVYLAICLYNCGPENTACAERCWRRYFWAVNVLVLVTVVFCLFGFEHVF